MLHTSILLAGLLCPASGAAARGECTPAANDWTQTGTDCKLYAAGDINGDGYADVVTVNGNRELCAAMSVNGWKAAPWSVLAGDVNPNGCALAVADVDATPGFEVVLVEREKIWVYARLVDGKLADRREVAFPAPDATVNVVGTGASTLVEARAGSDQHWTLRNGKFEPTPATQPSAADAGVISNASTFKPEDFAPPYDRAAALYTRFTGDFNHDAVADAGLVYTCARPHEYRAVRVILSPNPKSDDQDSDGLSDAEEKTYGSNPLDPDTDDDGLLDGWEVHGLPRKIELGELIKLFDPKAPESERDAQLNPLRQDVIVNLSYFEGVEPKQFRGEMPRIQALYRQSTQTNPDGSHGVWVHFRELPGFVPKAEFSMPWWDIGNKYFPRKERGLMHWMQVTPWGGGQSSENGDMGGAGNGWAVFTHEFGHQLSLSHSGDSRAGWCPLYPSLMSYAFSYSFDGDWSKIHFSQGRFRATVLQEKHLVEKLPYPYADVKYLANWPYRFPLKDNGDGTTLIDWNQNGKFDEGEVEADVNYGGSTYCGIRREHEAIGTAPCLAYVGNTCYLAAADQTRDHLWIKAYQGEEKWSEKRDVANSGTDTDPVLVGGKDYGLLFHRHLYGWHVTRFTDKELGAPVKIPDLPTLEMNACRVGDRVLMVSRHDDNALEYRWLTFKDNDFAKPVVTAPRGLETRSLVTPGLGVDPADGRVLLVSSLDNSHGGIFCMRVTWMKPDADRLWEQDMKWTRGESSGNGCCSRPVVAFTNAGQLNIFHHGGPDATGQMIAYRTSRVGNQTLDEGWLTCKLYDEWTRSRVAVGFANGPQGAIFAYRWDAGGAHINWLATAHNGFGIDDEPMRDFDDGEKISRWGIRFSILSMNPD